MSVNALYTIDQVYSMVLTNAQALRDRVKDEEDGSRQQEVLDARSMAYYQVASWLECTHEINPGCYDKPEKK